MSAWAATAFDRPPRGFPGLGERIAEREIHVRRDQRCTLCGAADPVGGGCCLSCLGRSADRLIFLRRPVSRGARTEQLETVRSLLPPELPDLEVALVADGHRALAAVPDEAVERVERALRGRGLAIRSASPTWSLASTPLSLLVLIVAVAATGALGALASQPWMGIAGPAVALLLWSLAQAQLHRPVVADPDRGGWLDPVDEGHVVRTLISLRPGRARVRFTELVRLGRLLFARAELAGDRATAEDVAALLVVGADVARDLDEVLAWWSEHTPAELFGRGHAERDRMRDTADQLEALLVRAVGVLGGSHRRLVNDGSCSGELSFLIHEIDRGRASYVRAFREVEELLAEGTAH